MDYGTYNTVRYCPDSGSDAARILFGQDGGLLGCRRARAQQGGAQLRPASRPLHLNHQGQPPDAERRPQTDDNIRRCVDGMFHARLLRVQIHV